MSYIAGAVCIIYLSELVDQYAGRKEDNLITTYFVCRTYPEDGTQNTIAEKLTTPVFLITERCIFTVDGTPESHKGTEILNEYRINRMNHDGSEQIKIAETNRFPLMHQSYSGTDVLPDIMKMTITLILLCYSVPMMRRTILYIHLIR